MRTSNNFIRNKINRNLKARVATFLYHDVTDNQFETGFQRKSAMPYKLGISEFENNIHEISESPIKISLVNDIDFIESKRYLLLTFDDGGKSALRIADIIEKYDCRGHFFITTSMIGTSTFLAKQDIDELYKRGHIIGSHSHSHPDVFYDLSFDEMIQEWQKSMDILSEIIQDQILCASVPGGEMNYITQLSAQEVGLKILFTSEPTLKPWKLGDIICLGRVCPKKGTSIKQIIDLANHKGLLKAMVERKIKNTVKKIYYPLRKYYKSKSIIE